MRQSLLETYGRQLKVAEAYVAKNYDGKVVSDNVKLTTAVLLDNTNRFMTEALGGGLSAATTRTDLGDWKKFCLNLTNIAVPSLIANDLVIVHPMTSYSGSVAYLEYVAKSHKNDMFGETLNGVFGLGKTGEARRTYASQIVIDTMTGEDFAPTLTPLVATAPAADSYMTVAGQYAFPLEKADAKVVKADGTVIYATIVATKDQKTSAITGYTLKNVVGGGDVALAEKDKVAYVAQEFQMETVPATDIPTIGPVMKRIPLVAEPRRIAVRYDQITAYQAKTDYGFSLDKQIAEQACGELAYEIDSEIVDMLYQAAKTATTAAEKEGLLGGMLTWSKTLPVGVSKYEHYQGFLEVVETARAIVYNRTKKFHPNYMVVAADVLPVLKFINGWTGTKVLKANGPYKVGELDNISVYVSPDIASGEYFFGLNGNDMMSSAGVYAPYMAIVPTQLLGTPDGGLAQGFSTWYAKALLNPNLLVHGRIVA